MYAITKPVFLTADEVALISVAIDSWEEGTKIAKGFTTVDPTVQTADELTDLMSGYEDDLVACQNIRRKVAQWSKVQNVSPKTIVLLSVYTYTASRLIRVCYNKLRA